MGNINVVTTNKAKVTTNKKPSGIIQGAFQCSSLLFCSWIQENGPMIQQGKTIELQYQLTLILYHKIIIKYRLYSIKNYVL